jgi:protein gp37
MADRSAIEWTDSTFNPWIGCAKVSPACDNCYAEVSTPSRTRGVEWGVGKPRQRTSAENWKLPLRWHRADFRECGDCGWRGEIDTLADDTCPACGKHERLEPARRRVFCASLADVFDNEVDPQWRADLMHLIWKTPSLDWLLLTKRIGNANAMLERAVADLSGGDHSWAHRWDKGFRHVAIGATVCNQAEADRDIPKLLRVPAAVRFLSIEPMLEPITVFSLDGPIDVPEGTGSPLHWVIAGGESGPHARPMHPDWARSLRDQCAEVGVPFLFKQWGEWLPSDAEDQPIYRGEHRYLDGPWHAYKIGKKAAGRLLDGVTHDGYPEAARADT